MREKLEQILAAYEELTARLGDPAVLGDQKEYARLAKEQRSQAPLAEKAREYLRRARQLDEAREVHAHRRPTPRCASSPPRRSASSRRGCPRSRTSSRS